MCDRRYPIKPFRLRRTLAAQQSELRLILTHHLERRAFGLIDVMNGNRPCGFGIVRGERIDIGLEHGLQRFLDQVTLGIESVAPADDNVNSLYEYLIGGEESTR